MAMQVNARLLEFAKQEEGVRYEAYDDMRPNHKLQPGDTVRGTLTNGIGHTGPDVFIGQVASEQQVADWYERDIKWAVNAVNKYVKVPLTQNQFNALVSFCFNVGEGNFRSSTLVAILNGDRDRNGTAESPPDYAGVPAQMRRWVFAQGGGDNPILANRREHEVALWLEQDDDPGHANARVV